MLNWPHSAKRPPAFFTARLLDYRVIAWVLMSYVPTKMLYQYCLYQPARALISIANPNRQEELERQAFARFGSL